METSSGQIQPDASSAVSRRAGEGAEGSCHGAKPDSASYFRILKSKRQSLMVFHTHSHQIKKTGVSVASMVS